MKKKVLWLVLVICSISCSDNSDGTSAPIREGQNDDAVVDKPKKITTDLQFKNLNNLPKDEGGEHLAKPVTSLLSPLGHYLYIPGSYHNNDLEYPLIVFLHGGGQRGESGADPNQLEKLLEHGPPFMIATNQWNPKYPCLVAAPQIGSGNWNSILIDGFIRYLLNNYRVNKNRIYLTGLSMGANGSWSYAENGIKGLVSAIVPICGLGNPSESDAMGQIPIWAFHGEEDNIISAFNENGSVPMVAQINNGKPTFSAKLTLYPGVGHDSWTRTYNGLGMGDENKDYDAFNMSIYDWMFQYRRED